MGLREMAGDMARASSGVWKGIADVVDPSGTRPKPQPAPPESAEPTPEPAGPLLGPDEATNTMVVPLDSWTKILDQLGNLHDAGQQLAEARERAAKAETENEFLRAQVRDLKASSGRRRAPAAPATPEGAAPESTPAAAPVSATARERRGTRARRTLSRWLEPKNTGPR